MSDICDLLESPTRGTNAPYGWLMEAVRLNLIDRLRPLARIASRLESTQIGRFGRSGLSMAFRIKPLLLHTKGRRSGLERRTPLAYLQDNDESILIVGGASGQTVTPDWVANLRAHPQASVTIDRERFDVLADEVTGPERDTLWCELAEQWPRIERYQRRAGRQVPVFRLIPLPAPPLSDTNSHEPKERTQ